MSWGFQNSKRFGLKYLHLKINMSKTGPSWTVKVGPLSWNSRTRWRIDGPWSLYWRSSRRAR